MGCKWNERFSDTIFDVVNSFGGFFSSRPLEFNGSQYAPPSLLRNPAERVSVQGQTDFTDACSSRPTCQTCSASSQYLFLYLPSLQRTLTYTWRDVMSLWGVDVHRYWLMAGNHVFKSIDAQYLTFRGRLLPLVRTPCRTKECVQTFDWSNEWVKEKACDPPRELDYSKQKP